MSGKFEGFSQEDINKLTAKRSSSRAVAKNVMSTRGIRRMPEPTQPASRATQPAPRSVQPTPKIDAAPKVSLMEDSTDESMTSLQEAVHFRPLSAKLPENPEISDISILHLDNHGSESSTPREAVVSPFKGVSLKDFETQRKLIEEHNKQKKELLYKAIEHHSQKTLAEVKKIEEIKTELAQLDNDLASDVAILRKQIENACLHYYNVQKQYDKIEAQFLKAKLELHNASEKKELLTEHLCTVISHNEDRKAKKLTELMEKVGLSPDGELEISNS